MRLVRGVLLEEPYLPVSVTGNLRLADLGDMSNLVPNVRL